MSGLGQSALARVKMKDVKLRDEVARLKRAADFDLGLKPRGNGGAGVKMVVRRHRGRVGDHINANSFTRTGIDLAYCFSFSQGRRRGTGHVTSSVTTKGRQ